MATSTPEDKIAYLLTVFKNATLPKPDYSAIAVEAGINTAQNAQRRFRSIVKAAGFDLVNDQIIGPDGSGGGTSTTVTTPSKKRKTPAKKPAKGEPSKKPKLSQPTVDSASDGNEEEVNEQVDGEAEADQDLENGTGEE